MSGLDRVSVVIPAHNEAKSIGRLLHALKLDEGEEIEALVVCNGCTDATAVVARSFSGTKVIELEEPSKTAAVSAGNEVARYPIVAIIDADVVLSREGVRALMESLKTDGALAVAPRRVLDRRGASLGVRWYYEVWEQLPQVVEGIFGRGAIMLSDVGRERLRAAPAVMADDLLASELFTRAERRVVDAAVVTVRTPRTMPDLLRRRTRSVVGAAQLDKLGQRSDAARTSVATLMGLCRKDPRLVPKVAVFTVVTVLARGRARSRLRRGDFATWDRDESSRSASTSAAP